MSKTGTLKTIVGDATEPKLADNEITIIPHIVNNENKWGSGFVIALSKKWSKPEKDYRKFIKSYKDSVKSSEWFLGKTVFSTVEENIVVANMFAQSGVGGVKPIRYFSLALCMNRIASEIFTFKQNERILSPDSNKIFTIHTPKFGSLRSQGNWDFIMELINELWINNGIDVTIYEFDEGKGIDNHIVMEDADKTLKNIREGKPIYNDAELDEIFDEMERKDNST